MRAPIFAAGHVHHPRRDKYLRLLALPASTLLLLLLLLPGPVSHPPPSKPILPSTLEEYRSSHSPGMMGAGPLVRQVDPITLNPCAAASCSLSCCVRVCLALPALPRSAIMPRQWGSGMNPLYATDPVRHGCRWLSRIRRSITIVATTQLVSIVPRFGHNSVTQNIAMLYQTFCIEYQCNLEPLAR